MSLKVGSNPFIDKNLYQTQLTTGAAVGEQARAVAGSISPALTKVDMQNIEAIAARRGGAVDSKGVGQPAETVTSNPVTAVEPQQEVVKLGTREALSYVSAPSVPAAKKFNNYIAGSAYADTFTKNNAVNDEYAKLASIKGLK